MHVRSALMAGLSALSAIGCGAPTVATREAAGPRDATRDAQRYQRDCDLGSAVGCGSLGLQYEKGLGVPKDEAHAAQLYQRACDGGVLPGCNNLGSMYARGAGVTTDDARAA